MQRLPAYGDSPTGRLLATNDVWVFSDHGQERTTPYEYVAGQTLEQSLAAAVGGLLGPLPGSPTYAQPTTRQDATHHRASWLSPGWLVATLFGAPEPNRAGDTSGPQIAAIGPLALVYLNRDTTPDARIEIGRRLVHEFHVPLAAIVLDEEQTLVITPEYEAVLPEDADLVLADVSFSREIVADLTALCRHPDAGDLLLSGWNGRETTLSFVRQHGAHAGFGPARDACLCLVAQRCSCAPIGGELPASRRPLRCGETFLAPANSDTPKAAHPHPSPAFANDL